jgi:hypothetical protein
MKAEANGPVPHSALFVGWIGQETLFDVEVDARQVVRDIGTNRVVRRVSDWLENLPVVLEWKGLQSVPNRVALLLA